MANYNYYTTKEDKVIAEAVSKYPTNLRYAFECASDLLPDRSFYSVEQRYYSVLRKLSTALMATGSKKGVIYNVKITKRIGKLAPGTANLDKKMLVSTLSKSSIEKAVASFISDLSDKDKLAMLNKIISSI